MSPEERQSSIPTLWQEGDYGREYTEGDAKHREKSQIVRHLRDKLFPPTINGPSLRFIMATAWQTIVVRV